MVVDVSLVAELVSVHSVRRIDDDAGETARRHLLHDAEGIALDELEVLDRVWAMVPPRVAVNWASSFLRAVRRASSRDAALITSGSSAKLAISMESEMFWRETSVPISFEASIAVSVMKCISPSSAWSILCRRARATASSAGERFFLRRFFPAPSGKLPHPKGT